MIITETRQRAHLRIDSSAKRSDIVTQNALRFHLLVYLKAENVDCNIKSLEISFLR